MAHFCLLAILDPGDDLAGVLRPFHADDSGRRTQAHFVFRDDPLAELDRESGRQGFWRNPIGKWDGWVVGGNWHGLLSPSGSVRVAVSPSDLTNSVTLADLLGLVEADPARLDQVFAVIAGGDWYEAASPPAPNWVRNLVCRLASLHPQATVTVVDCHC